MKTSPLDHRIHNTVDPALTMANQRAKIILVDDDPLIVESLGFVLADEFDVVVASSREQAKNLLLEGNEVPDIALVDLGLPPTPHTPQEGFQLIQELLAFNQRMKILVLSGQSDRANIQHALTLGAVDFVPKPCDAELLRSRLRHQLLILDAERTVPKDAAPEQEVLLGESSAIRTLRELVQQFADTPFPVLIEGESGCGKELVANCLHTQSERQDEPFVTINCAAFTAELLEAQLFGHAKGAFTGADQQRVGFFEQSGQGTLFLDEVGEMPAALQTKFLRVLENGEFYRVGETIPRKAQARIIAATNRDLRKAVSNGAFRQDLYHRLSVLSVSVPPLRARNGDWRLLFSYFQDQYQETVPSFSLSAAAEKLLTDYPFPGNVRELRNIVIRLGAKYPRQEIDAEAMRAELEPQELSELGRFSDASDEELEQRLLNEDFSLEEELLANERAIIRAALKISDGNLSKAAKLLDVNRTTLYSKVSRLGLTDNEG
ncbi:MAG: sigma-54 dependent transcriptional regulator [Pseudomonadota bacterium]